MQNAHLRNPRAVSTALFEFPSIIYSENEVS